jgi:NAD(P)-dependent dehydrogenase (short-subunit alcohol dehydrogenase family)
MQGRTLRKGVSVELAGKVALVTGGAVRVGRALALALAGRGVRIALHYGESRKGAEETAAIIGKMGVEVELVGADLRETAQVAGLMERAVERFGRVDILVNSAAIFGPGELADSTEALWDEHFAINLKAPFFLSQAFALHVGTDRPGVIVNIADWRAVRPGAHNIPYTLTKGGIVTLTKSLALALAPNIRVNAVAPGAILPPPGEDEGYLTRLAEHIPLKRHGGPEEVARALLYLIEAEFVTGQILFVDGGERL